MNDFTPLYLKVVELTLAELKSTGLKRILDHLDQGLPVLMDGQVECDGLM